MRHQPCPPYDFDPMTGWGTWCVTNIIIVFHSVSDEVTASRALELVHGYEFKGKPVIIHYGKKKSSTPST